MTNQRVALKSLNQLNTIHFRHDNIGNDKIRHLRYGILETLLAVAGGNDLITVLEAVRKIIQHRIVIIHNQHLEIALETTLIRRLVNIQTGTVTLQLRSCNLISINDIFGRDMAVAKRKTEREHAAALPVLAVIGLNGSMVHTHKHLTVIQSDTHTHCDRCQLVVSPIETLEYTLNVILVQADAGVRYRHLNIVMKRSLLMVIGPHLNIHLNLTAIIGVLEGV